MRKKNMQLYVEKCLSSCLYSCLQTEKQRLSPAKNFNSLECLCWKKSLQRSALQTETSVNFAPENSLPPRKWQSQTACSLLMVVMLYIIYSKKNFVTFNHNTSQQHPLLSEGCWFDSPWSARWSKILNPKLLLMCWMAPCMAATTISVWMNV